jgi:hypothetical protein
MEEELYGLLEKSSRYGFGRYQFIVFVACSMGIMSGSFIQYNLAYFTLMPKLECIKNGAWQPCDNKEICLELVTPQIEYRMDWENPFSLHNMIESLDLICASHREIGALGGVFFAGWALTAAVIPPLSDKHGRRKVTILCMIFQLPVIIGFLFSNSYYFTLLCNFSLGCLAGGRVMT